MLLDLTHYWREATYTDTREYATLKEELRRPFLLSNSALPTLAGTCFPSTQSSSNVCDRPNDRKKAKQPPPLLHGLDACVRYLGSLVSYAISSHGDLEYGVSTNPEWPNMAVPVHNRLFRCVRLTCRRHTLSLPRSQAGKVHRTPAFHDSQVSCSPTTNYIIGVYTPDAPEHDETVWLPPPPSNYGETHCSAVSPES